MIELRADRGAMSKTQEAHAPALAAPVWVKLLTMATGRLVTSAESSTTGPRLVVATPTSRHIPAVTALTALRLPDFNEPSMITAGMRVATVLSRKFCDTKVSKIRDRWGLNGITFDTSRKPLPPLALLPEDLELDRRDLTVPAGVFEPIGALGYDEEAEWTYQRLCLRPIVLLTHRPGQAIADLEDLAQAEQWWNPVQSAALAEPEQGSQLWFRRPIIVITPAAAIAETWLAQMAVSLVVVAGYSAWRSGARHIWGSAPQVLVLNQRSSDVSEFREWFDGTEFPALDMPFGRQLRKSGVTFTAFSEPLARPSDGFGVEEGDEWEF
jgi:hypothetical protein